MGIVLIVIANQVFDLGLTVDDLKYICSGGFGYIAAETGVDMARFFKK